jgi:hypothetical protein
MIKPTVGRVVWFYPPKFAEGGFNAPHEGEPCAAIVAKVWSDTMVNLSVFDANGVSHARTSVRLVQEGTKRPDGYFCEWMPYQVGQAKPHSA